MLFIVASPLGNLSDFSIRAISTLQSCDLILCEDTRHSLTLLKKHGIEKKLISYHQHNESKRTQEIVRELEEGRNIALLSDAGTPGISDPGHKLIAACYSAGVRVVPIPGPCAFIAALSASPLSTERFQFIGFLPKSLGALKKELQDALQYRGTTACYESPFRLVKTLDQLVLISPNAPVVVCRELTKFHEEIKYGTSLELLEYYKNKPPKGEIVLLIGHYLEETFSNEDPLKLVTRLEKSGLSRQEALKEAAKILKMTRKSLYQYIHSDKTC